jgi:salicylate hydroxylase
VELKVGQCLAKVGGQDISEALHVYESRRFPRASRIQAASRENKARFHLPDGPQQRERDAQLGDRPTDWFLKAIAWVYGHDALAAVDAIPAISSAE